MRAVVLSAITFTAVTNGLMFIARLVTIGFEIPSPLWLVAKNIAEWAFVGAVFGVAFDLLRGSGRTAELPWWVASVTSAVPAAAIVYFFIFVRSDHDLGAPFWLAPVWALILAFICGLLLKSSYRNQPDKTTSS
jgi:hypothetical protein